MRREAELDAQEQSLAAHVVDEGIAQRQAAQTLKQLRSHSRSVIHQILFCNNATITQHQRGEHE